jgi:iron complex transport system ATP-binding protein
VSALSLDTVSVRRGARAVLHEASVRFSAGRLTAVIGPNGAGKSTLLAVAAGLIAPDAGAVRLGDVPLGKVGRQALARRRAYLPQAPRVDWPISVERVVALGLTAHLPAFGGLSPRLRARVGETMEQFDLTDLRDRPATELSGGELARVMLGRPEVLIVDEPTAGLDPRHALDAGRRLRALAEAGCAVVVALHDLDLALRIADDAVALRDGVVVEHGAADTVLTAEVLSALYDVEMRVVHDAHGASVRVW